MQLCCIRKVRGHPKNKLLNLSLFYFTCSNGTTQASLSIICVKGAHAGVHWSVCTRDSVCVCSSPLLVYLSGSPIRGVAKALAKWAAGHPSWLTITNEHTPRGKHKSHQVTSALPPPRASIQFCHLSLR